MRLLRVNAKPCHFTGSHAVDRLQYPIFSLGDTSKAPIELLLSRRCEWQYVACIAIDDFMRRCL